MALIPEIQRTPVAGLVFDRSLGHQFKALTSPSGEYYWKPHLMALLRRCPNLAYFLPSAEFCDSGAKVLFTRFSGNDELLTKTVGLDEPGVKLPESAYSKLQDALAEFKSMAGGPGLTPEESRFISEFRLPDRQQFPAAYRVLKTSWYSSDRLFVLWGLEPGNAGGVPVIKILAGAGNAPSTRPNGNGAAGDAEGKPGASTGSSSAQSSPPPSPGAGGNRSNGSAAAALGTGLGAGAIGGGVGSAIGSGAASGGGYGVGDGTTVVTHGRRRWWGCLWFFLLLLLLLLLILLLSQCAPTSCSDGTVAVPDQKDRTYNKTEPKHSPSPYHPKPYPPSPPEVPPHKPEVPPEQKWWREEVLPEEKKARSGQIAPLPKRTPLAPGAFEVYIHAPTELIQRPRAVGVHLGLRYHGEGQIKNVTWTLADGVKEQGEFLDELVPFDGYLVASTEIDVAYTYVDANGVEREDGFSFRYSLEGAVTFKEQIGEAEDKRSPAEKEKAREAEKGAQGTKQII
jgi:hypothetical protein